MQLKTIMRRKAKDAVVYTSLALFSKKGCAEVTLGEIAEEAAQPLDVILKMFPNKRDLIHCILQEYLPEVIDYYEPDTEEILEQLQTESPSEVLTRHILAYSREDDKCLMAINRFLFMEQHRDPQVAKAAHHHYVERPVRNLTNIMDQLVSLGAIPPCDTWALAQLWARTSQVYGMLGCHSDNMIDFQEYFRATQIFVKMAVLGLKVIPSSEISMEWKNPAPPFRVRDREEQRRKRFCRAAVELSERRGYSSISLQDIKDAAELEGDSPYLTKADMLKDMVSDFFDKRKDFMLHYFALSTGERGMEPLAMDLHIGNFLPPDEAESYHQRLCRLIFSEQYHNENIKDYFVGGIYRDRYAVTEGIDALVQRQLIPVCESWKIAAAYVHAMCSLTVESTVFPERTVEINWQRRRIAAPLFSLLLYGYQSNQRAISRIGHG